MKPLLNDRDLRRFRAVTQEGIVVRSADQLNLRRGRLHSLRLSGNASADRTPRM